MFPGGAKTVKGSSRVLIRILVIRKPERIKNKFTPAQPNWNKGMGL
ncbi:MAG TPA: hypothetical protein VK563_17950 [Puia sp.]|nr:hypothetical protein [Puia sp.]